MCMHECMQRAYVHVCMSTCMRACVCACATLYMQKSEDNFHESTLFFHHVGPKDQTQLFRLRHLYWPPPFILA